MLHLRRLLKEETGEDLVEYVLMAVLFSLTAIAAVKALGKARAMK
jgi:Flp pilus assembly pilin Flp